MSNTIELTYIAGPGLPSVRLRIDGNKHPWWKVGDHIAAKWSPGFDPNARDPVFDRIMKRREDARRKSAGQRNW
jgi:hypothetical protein